MASVQPTLADLEARVLPTRTPIPNAFFDTVLTRLSRPEVHVMCYLFRHAWRNRASTAVVSHSQFLSGTRAPDGSVVDRGAGIRSATSLIAAITGLEDKGYVTRHHQVTTPGSPAPTLYALHIGFYGTPGAPLQPRFDIAPAGVGQHQRRCVRFGSRRAWEDIKRQYDDACLDCGRREPEITLTRDHIMPTSQGGPNIAANIAPRCRSCNARKGDRITVVAMGLLS